MLVEASVQTTGVNGDVVPCETLPNQVLKAFRGQNDDSLHRLDRAKVLDLTVQHGLVELHHLTEFSAGEQASLSENTERIVDATYAARSTQDS